MSLRFDSLSVRNFGPYRNIESLDLSTEPDAPVVLIHGENTLGKTRLFQALRWCLYGALLPQQSVAQGTQQQLADYLNRKAVRDGENDLEVGLRFTANDNVYSLIRKATFTSGGSPRITTDLRIGGVVVQQASIEAEIGRLLHPQISEFFLFDGEQLKNFYDRLNTSREREFIRSSIATVLGIPALQLAERDVAVLAADAVQRHSRALKNASDRDRINRELRILTDQQTSVQKDRDDIKKALRTAEESLREVKDEIGTIAELQADAREQETLEASIEGDKQEESRLRKEMKDLLIAGWRAPLAAKLTEVLDRVRQENNDAQDRQEEVRKLYDRVEMLRDRINGGVCATCEQQLPPADEATRQDLVASEARLAELGDLEGPDLILERRVASLIDTTTEERYREKQEQLNKVVTAQFTKGRRLDVLKDHLKDNDAVKIRALGDKQERLDDVIEGYERTLKTFEPKLAEITAQQQRLARSLDRLPGAQASLATEALFYEYVQTVLVRTIERYQERTRDEVEATASEMFLRLVRDAQAYQGLRIGRDYEVELIDVHGEKIDTSEGGKQLVALSLIGALKQAAVRGGPVVLDSPLARLDLEHRASVLKTWVPSLGNQAVLLVQSGELTQDDAQVLLAGRIGQEYQIFRPNDDPDEAEIERTQ